MNQFWGVNTVFDDIPTLICIDIGGDELDVLEQLNGKIEEYRLKYAICAYHGATD